MPIQTNKITFEQKRKILSTTEGHFIDLKSIDISPIKLEKHISAFANADGGDLYIGLNEDKKIINFHGTDFYHLKKQMDIFSVSKKLFHLDVVFFIHSFQQKEKRD